MTPDTRTPGFKFRHSSPPKTAHGRDQLRRVVSTCKRLVRGLLVLPASLFPKLRRLRRCPLLLCPSMNFSVSRQESLYVRNFGTTCAAVLIAVANPARIQRSMSGALRNIRFAVLAGIGSIQARVVHKERVSVPTSFQDNFRVVRAAGPGSIVDVRSRIITAYSSV